MNFYHRSRRLLLGTKTGSGGDVGTGNGRTGVSRPANFDTNMVIILAALLCALICALGINSIVRYILRCIRRSNLGDEIQLESQPSICGRTGIKKGALCQIPVAVYGSGEGEGVVWASECPICLAEFIDGEKIRVLPKCQHCFHVWCVDVWLAAHTSCPTCRVEVLAEEEAGEGVRQAGDGPVTGTGGFSDEMG